jgi:hypothetical protein
MDSYIKTTYTQEGMVYCLNMIRFPNDYINKKNYFLQALDYVFKFRNRCKYFITYQELSLCCSNMFNLCYNNNSQLARDIADWLLTNLQDYSLINRLRDLSHPKKITKTVYEDSQNVHNSKINNSVIECAELLCKKYYSNIDCIGNIENILIQKYPSIESLIKNSISYIEKNTSFFGKSKISLSQLFISIWFWIIESSHKEELEKRLIEELKEMKGQCTTGHLARLVNVIQGFTDEEKLCIKISIEEQINSVVRTFLTNLLEKCKDEKIIDGLIDKNEKFIEYIKNSIKNKIIDWKKEYENEEKLIYEATNNFCGIKIFNN